MEDKKILFIWNTIPYPEKYIKQFHCDADIIRSEEELDNKNLANYGLIVISAELNWKGHKFSDFFGLDVLKKLRVYKRAKNPILICSVLPEKFFYSDKYQGAYEILKSTGHLFQQSPLKSKINTEDFQTLDDETLEDIIDSLCDIEGLLGEIIHRLKNATIVSENDKKLSVNEFKEKLINTINNATSEISNLFINEPKVSEIRDKIIDEINDKIKSSEDFVRAIEIVSNFEGYLRLLLPAKKEIEVIKLSDKPKWKVLFVDDEEHIRQRIKEEFDKRNIECITVSSSTKALEELRNDEKTNWITATIVDYRLKEPDECWQNMQGYSLLKHIHLNTPNFLSYFALTAANRKALMRVQSSYQMRVIPFSKEDILSSTGVFNIFTERIIEEANKTYEAVLNQPQLTSWRYSTKKNKLPLREYYRAHRASVDYENSEEDISKQAKDYVENINHAYNIRDPEPKGHNFEFQTNLNDDKINSEELKKFRLRLLGRRIAIGLYAELGFTREHIFYAMRKSPYLDIDKIPVERRPKEKSIDALLATALALSLEDDFPDNLLVEELYWLENYLNIDLNEANRDAYLALEGALEDFQIDIKNEPTFESMEIKISNFQTAKETLEKAFKVAEKYKCKQKLINELRKIFTDSDFKLKKALRVSGLDKLLKKYITTPDKEPVSDIKTISIKKTSNYSDENNFLTE